MFCENAAALEMPSNDRSFASAQRGKMRKRMVLTLYGGIM
jgi:hypothetical protein